MVNTGTISEVKGDLLTIVFDRPEACGECHACARGSESCSKHVIQMKGKGNPGDKVEVEISDDHVLMASAVAYLIPLFGLIVGLAGGYVIASFFLKNNSELLIAFCGFAGVVLGYLMMRLLDPVFSKGRWQPRIVSIRTENEEGE